MSKLVQARVEEIRPGGIVVAILFDARKGFVRWRELSWDRRMGVRPPAPKVGELIEAVIFEEPGFEETESERRLLPLSIRRVTDPWAKAADKYKRGMAVRSEVVNMRQAGIFVQIEPGIDGLIAPLSLPIPPGKTHDAVLAIGDQVEADILRLDLHKQ